MGAKELVIFGFKDGLVGQVFHYLCAEGKYVVTNFISVDSIPFIDVELEHSKRPNRKTEFPQDGKIFGKPLTVTNNYVEKLKRVGTENALVLVENPLQRMEICSTLESCGVSVISYVHPTVTIGHNASVGNGSIILPNCYIGYKTDIGNGTIIQSNCVIEHHNKIGNWCDINPGLLTGGFMRVDNFVEINLGVTIINRVVIGAQTRIGAGSLVLGDCEPNSLYFGRPAKRIRQHKITNNF